VLITKHNAPQAVVISFERYQALTQTAPPDLDLLTEEFDELVQRMQAPEAKEGVLAALRASPEEIARAAVAYAQRDRP
jgi:PHD/YefM family antitoxin component YafN of YafNO toxin-antitoxin module